MPSPKGAARAFIIVEARLTADWLIVSPAAITGDLEGCGAVLVHLEEDLEEEEFWEEEEEEELEELEEEEELEEIEEEEDFWEEEEEEFWEEEEEE